MVRRGFLPALLFLAFLVLLNGNSAVGLFESSEARYAEVAREMVETGDYLSPQIDYVHHFTKPPLTYWITSAAYGLFGVNTFGARFFLAVAAVLILYLTARLYRLDHPGADGVWAAAFLFFSLEFFAMGKVLTTDLYLTLWITAGFLLWSLRERGMLGGRAFSVLCGMAAALGFMTKGPVCLLFWGAVLVPYALWKDRGRSLSGFLSPWCWGTFLVLVAPWFLAVGFLHPGLLSYLILRESFEAAYSSNRYHPGPFYYYLPVFLAGFLPWWVLVAARWREALKPERKLWLLWAVVPLVLWSFFAAKLPTYILPTFPAWALLAAGVSLEGKGAPRWSLIVAAFATMGVPAAVLYYLGSCRRGLPSPGWFAAALLCVSSAFAISSLVPAWRRKVKPALVLIMAACLAIQIAAPSLCRSLEEEMKIRYKLGQMLAAKRLPNESILEYQTTLYSIPFYVRGPVAAFRNMFVKKKYVKGIPHHIMVKKETLNAFLKEHPRVWVVTDRKWESQMQEDVPGLVLVMREGHHSLWATKPVARKLSLLPSGRSVTSRATEPGGGPRP